MEYQTKKTQILSNVEFSNLLSFNLVQNKLERNFRFIVDALMLNQAKTDTLEGSHTQTKQKHETQIRQVQKQLNDLKARLQRNQKQSNMKNDNLKSIKSKPILEEISVNNQNNQKSTKKRLTQKDITSTKNLNLPATVDTNWQKQKNELLNDMKNIKEKLNFMSYWQTQLDSLKKDLNGLKGELSTFNMRSNKSVKRQSIFSIKGPLVNQDSFKNLNLTNQKENQNQSNQNNNKQGESDFKNLQQKLSEQANKEFNSIYIEINTLKLSFQELKDWISDCKKANFKHGHAISDLNQNLSKLSKDRITDNQNIEKELKQIKIQLMNNVPTEEQLHIPTKSSGKQEDKSQSSQINFKNQLNDKLSKLQSMVQSFITESEFNRFKNQVRDQLQNLQKKDTEIIANTEEEIKKIYDLLNEKNTQILKLVGDVQVCNQQIIVNNNQSQRKNNICLSKIEELKKSIQNLKQDLEFYQSIGAQNQKPPQKVIIVESQNQNQKQTQQKKYNSLTDKSMEELKKYFGSKMNDIRSNLLGMIRDLQKKINNKTSYEQDIVKLWDKVNQTSLFLGKKADQQDTKKNILYLQKNLSRLTTYLMKAQDNTEDARVARTNNWYCLSCDKNLSSYQGKIGKYIVWDTMPLKGINKVGKEQKKVLPQLKR